MKILSEDSRSITEVTQPGSVDEQSLVLRLTYKRLAEPLPHSVWVNFFLAAAATYGFGVVIITWLSYSVGPMNIKSWYKGGYLIEEYCSKGGQHEIAWIIFFFLSAAFCFIFAHSLCIAIYGSDFLIFSWFSKKPKDVEYGDEPDFVNWLTSEDSDVGQEMQNHLKEDKNHQQEKMISSLIMRGFQLFFFPMYTVHQTAGALWTLLIGGFDNGADAPAFTSSLFKKLRDKPLLLVGNDFYIFENFKSKKMLGFVEQFTGSKEALNGSNSNEENDKELSEICHQFFKNCVAVNPPTEVIEGEDFDDIEKWKARFDARWEELDATRKEKKQVHPEIKVE
jgi:hypothetical protein